MAEKVITATDEGFPDLIAGDTPVLVDFWAEWCAPCRMIAPVVEKIAGSHSDKITVAKLNVDENPQTAMQYEVMSIPTLIVYQGGNERKRIVGARPEQAILAEIDEFLA
jgi:thioredoxin 1